MVSQPLPQASFQGLKTSTNFSSHVLPVMLVPRCLEACLEKNSAKRWQAGIQAFSKGIGK